MNKGYEGCIILYSSPANRRKVILKESNITTSFCKKIPHLWRYSQKPLRVLCAKYTKYVYVCCPSQIQPNSYMPISKIIILVAVLSADPQIRGARGGVWLQHSYLRNVPNGKLGSHGARARRLGAASPYLAARATFPNGL